MAVIFVHEVNCNRFCKCIQCLWHQFKRWIIGFNFTTSSIRYGKYFFSSWLIRFLIKTFFLAIDFLHCAKKISPAKATLLTYFIQISINWGNHCQSCSDTQNRYYEFHLVWLPPRQLLQIWINIKHT